LRNSRIYVKDKRIKGDDIHLETQEMTSNTTQQLNHPARMPGTAPLKKRSQVKDVPPGLCDPGASTAGTPQFGL
jgi:hypothetical protein